MYILYFNKIENIKDQKKKYRNFTYCCDQNLYSILYLHLPTFVFEGEMCVVLIYNSI